MTTKITKISAKFYTTLSKKVNIADTTATLSIATDLDGDVLPSGRYGFTIDEGNSSIEYVEADLVGTALTNIKRIDPTTLLETTGFLKEHRAGAEVKITDFTVLARLRNVLLGIEDLDDGAPIKYGASPTLSDPLMLATVEYVLSVVTGGAVTFDSQVVAGVAGESISSGQWVYFKESDGRWYKTDANTQATVKNVKIGMAKGAGTTGNAISGGVFVGGIEKTGTYIAGNTYYLSNTAGALSTTAGEFEALVGIADANGELVFLNVYDPEGTTPDEKDALAGTVGTPNANNKFVTENGTTQSGTDQEQTTQNSSVELGEANATTKKNKIAQSFQPTKEKIRGVKLYKSANTGTAFTGTVTVTLQADSAGSPSGSALATKVFTNSQWATEDVGEIEALFATEYASLVCVPATTYWIVIETSTSDNSNHPNLGFNTAGGYANGTLKYNNTTDGWVEISGDDLYFKTLEGNASQAVKTDSDGKIVKDFFDPAKMPFFGTQQTLKFEQAGGFRNGASNKDGSVFVLKNNDSTIIRFQRDSITGQYYITHTGSVTSSAYSTLTIIGDYIYYFYDPGNEVVCKRYDLADFGNATTMTMPTYDTSGANYYQFAWNDGAYLYLNNDKQSTTYYKLSISGTTLTQSATGTCLSLAGTAGTNGHFNWFDGENVYVAYGTTNAIRKFDNIAGSSVTAIYDSYIPSITSSCKFILPIDNGRVYVGTFRIIYDQTAQIGQVLELYPFSKV